jgi:hypothetical protein
MGELTLVLSSKELKVPLLFLNGNKKRKGRTLHSMMRLLIGCMEILFLILAATILA